MLMREVITATAGTPDGSTRLGAQTSAPTPGTVHLWCLDTASLSEREPLGAEILPAAERARADLFRRPRDRFRFTAAHVMLRRLLGVYTGVPPEEVRIVKETCASCGGTHGKPVLALPAVSLHFSLAHGGELVLVGVAQARIGVDVEPMAGRSAAASLSRFLHRVEQQELATLRAGERADAFTRIWARKEAYLKGVGTGLDRDLAADYVGADAHAGTPAGWTIADVRLAGGYAAACAVAGGIDDIHLRRLTLRSRHLVIS
jgi:4'-phosphopantetheinyl transferase